MLGILSYLHGNIFLWEYGVLDGNDLNLANNWRLVFDIALWLTVLVACIVYHKILYRHAVAISCLLISMQLVGLAIQYFQSPKEPQKISNAQGLPNSLSQFSKNGNVIHIILDAFQSDIFDELQSENSEYDEIFSGFTFFKDATTSSAVTFLSVPASLSGKVFTNKQHISEYLEDTLRGYNLYSHLNKNNYEIEVATPLGWNKPNDYFSSFYRIPSPYKTEKQILGIALLIFDLSIFRQIPHPLKPHVYNSHTWLFSNKFSHNPSQQFDHFSHTAFLDDLSDNISVNDRAPVYKFLHLVTPHAPMVTDENCSFSGSALPYIRSNFKQQSLCTILSIKKFLQRLKSNNIYDSSLILIHGDHGGGVEFFMSSENGAIISSKESKYKLWGAPIPLVLVKPRNESGPIRISNSAVELSDIPATVSSLLSHENNFPGKSMFSNISDKRKRYYYWSDIHRNEAAAKDFYDYVYTYDINGSPFQEKSWSKGEVLGSSVLDNRKQYLWDRRISFGLKGTYKIAQITGWSSTSSDNITWNNGAKAALRLDLKKTTKNIELVVNVKPALAKGIQNSQRVEVYIGESKAGEWIVKEEGFHDETMVIPNKFIAKGGLTEIRFNFPNAISPKELGTGKDSRKLALAFRSILLREIEK